MKRLVLLLIILCACNTTEARRRIPKGASENTVGWIKILSPKAGRHFDSSAKITIRWECSPNLTEFRLHMIDQQGTHGRIDSEDPIYVHTYTWNPRRIANNKKSEPVLVILTGRQTHVGEVQDTVKILFPKLD